MSAELGNRLADSVETALKLSDGLLHVEIVAAVADDAEHKKGDMLVFSEKFSCPESGFAIDEIEPKLFSFNSPNGACPSCGGLGTEY